MTSTAGSDPQVSAVDDVLITAELASRAYRSPDFEAESRALRLLAQEMATNPPGVLQKCAELVMELCDADSAGISILEPGGTSGILRWHAAAGAFAPNLHGTMPREASPCGTVVERDGVLLFNEAERFFSALRGVEPRIYENLLAPWHVRGEPVGILWAIKHTPEGQFDAEDARLLQSLASFASAAFQMTSALDQATAERALLEQRTKELREREQRLRSFGEASQNVLWIRNADTLQYEYVSPAFETIYGANRQTLLAQNDLRRGAEFTHPDDREQVLDNLRRVCEGERLTQEFRIRRGIDGETRWISETDFPLCDEQGRVHRVGGIGQDITERKRAEDALRGSEERLRVIVENARNYAIFTTDPEGICTDWREGAEGVFGFSRDEMIGQSGDIVFTPEDRENGQPEKERVTAASEGKALDVRWHVRKGGSRVFIDGVSTALRDPSGELIGFLKIGQDVTERHAADERQKLLLAELQHRVRNIMAMVRSVVRQSSEGSDSVEDFVAHLVGRLDAMARTQGLLTRALGAQVNLEDLVRDELHAQVADETRLTIRGEEVSLSPKAAEVLTLAIHELATNSVKYGALSDPSGRLAIAWEETRENSQAWLAFTWQEWSPAREAAPVEAGFGTELIEERVPYELRGRASLQIHQGGVRAEIAFPLTDGSSILETGPARGGMS